MLMFRRAFDVSEVESVCVFFPVRGCSLNQPDVPLGYCLFTRSALQDGQPARRVEADAPS